MCGPECRHELFEAARRRGGYTIGRLWVDYLGLGGTLDRFTLEAYLHGLVPLPPDEQDVLATAINERLDDVYRAAIVPYLDTTDHQHPPGEDAVDVLDILDELLRRPLHPPEP